MSRFTSPCRLALAVAFAVLCILLIAPKDVLADGAGGPPATRMLTPSSDAVFVSRLHIPPVRDLDLGSTPSPYDAATHPAKAAAEPAPPPAATIAAPAGDLVLSFAPGETEVNDTMVSRLLGIAEAMKAKPRAAVELRGEATAADGSLLAARRTALWRARSVRTFLIDHGVRGEQIALRANQAEVATALRDQVDLRLIEP